MKCQFLVVREPTCLANSCTVFWRWFNYVMLFK